MKQLIAHTAVLVNPNFQLPLVQQIKFYANHKKLVQDVLYLHNSQVMSWRILLEEYRLEIVYIAGISNIVANAISRLDIDHTCNVFNKILKGLDENEYIYGKQMLTRVLS